MNIVKNIEQYNENGIFFCDPIKNNVMNEGIFIRILYSSYNLVMNGIYLLVPLNDVTCEKYYSKYRCHFNVLTHKNIIEHLRAIEEGLLKKYELTDKTPQFKIYDHLKIGNIKIFNDIGNNLKCTFILKISGIWETHTNYGLTYKFIKV
jgi:hypothetical protein